MIKGRQGPDLGFKSQKVAQYGPLSWASARCFTKLNWMKKLALSVVVLVCLVAVMGADFRTIPQLNKVKKAPCTGYTIIEFDKGIDCHGDTIKLVRKNGFAERAR